MPVEESIYALVPPPQEIYSRPARHTSKFPPTIAPAELPFGDKKRAGHGTFGKPDGASQPQTDVFLRSHAKSPILPEPRAPTLTKTKLKAPTPAKDDKPTMGLHSDKNYISSNAVDVILSKPKPPKEEFLWTAKAGYGDVPLYLRKLKATLSAEKDSFEEFVRMRTQPVDSRDHVSQLSSEDRSGLILHLKRKWGKVNEAYQRFSLAVDNEQKKLRKEDLERQLAEIERDIKTLERGEVVLVVDE